ncbi:MAG TPA: PDZ domain-containing protein [Acidimicrobiales bacterium]|nr:PDZ domain-containing protein [Acidimicrobiales bacterium]
MNSGGSFTEGGIPDDPDGQDDEAAGLQRGWMPPDDRLWRHPSEIARFGPPRPVSSLVDPAGGGWHRRKVRRASLTAGVVGVAAVATTVAVALSLVDAQSSTTALKVQAGGGASAITVATTSLTTSVIGHDVMRLVASVRPSLVGLEPLAGGAAARMTGVVLPGGALVVTSAVAVAGVSQVDVVTSDGRRHPGKVVGSDAHSGVAVISTGGGLVPATFADEAVQPDDLAVVACLCSGAVASSTSPPDAPAAAGVGMVKEVGTDVTPQGGSDLVNAIEAEMPLGPTSWGGVLLDGHGRVIGILDGQTNTAGDTLGVFVPAPLAEGVATELAQAHTVDHGWLGVVCGDGGSAGATVTKILPGSPAAAAGLHSGDVVVGVDTHAVSTVADLQERLYTVPPGTTVQLDVERGTASAEVSVKLADAPAS